MWSCIDSGSCTRLSRGATQHARQHCSLKLHVASLEKPCLLFSWLGVALRVLKLHRREPWEQHMRHLLTTGRKTLVFLPCKSWVIYRWIERSRCNVGECKAIGLVHARRGKHSYYGGSLTLAWHSWVTSKVVKMPYRSVPWSSTHTFRLWVECLGTRP